MSPEILNKTLNDQNFDSYKAADLYALGLVFWEILRRCRTNPEGQQPTLSPALIPFECSQETTPSPTNSPTKTSSPTIRHSSKCKKWSASESFAHQLRLDGRATR